MSNITNLMCRKSGYGNYYQVEFIDRDASYNFYDVLEIDMSPTHIILRASDRIDFMPVNMQFKVTDQSVP